MSKRLAYILKSLGHANDNPKPKVGLTGRSSAETRCREYRREGYALMFLLGKVRGRKLAIEAERYLIERYESELANLGIGGEGITAGRLWWIYVMLERDDLPRPLAGRDLMARSC